MIRSNTITSQYHYHSNEGEPDIKAKLGDAAGFAPYIVVDIGPFTVYNLTPEQLRKLATVCASAADDLEKKQGEQPF